MKITKFRVILPTIFILTIGFFALGTLVVGSEAPDQQSENQEYFLVSQGDDLATLEDKIENNGGQLKHELADSKAGVAVMKPEIADDLRVNGEVALITDNTLDQVEVEQFGAGVAEAAATWNYIQTQVNEIPAVEPGPIEGDSLTEPGVSNAGTASAEAYGVGSKDTSEFMLGEVSVGVFLVESDGSIDTQSENWDAARESRVRGEIQSAMDFWSDTGGTAADLSFNYHFINGRTDSRAQTGYEPIKRVSWTSSGGQDLWINEIMGNLGYSNSSYFDRVRAYLNDIREQDSSDWAFAIFVVDSESDSNGQFNDGKFAYAYYGGPFMVLTYDNNGYNISNMDAVVAHETGHIFYALDQYYAAYQPCTKTLGYLNAPNQNSLYSSTGGSCASNEASIMRGGVTPYINRSIDYYANGQIGLWDSDSDGIYDIVDTFPDSSITSSSAVSSSSVSVSGSTHVNKVANENSYTGTLRSVSERTDITVNVISAVQYRVDDGTWQGATAVDDAFNEPTEDFTFTASNLDRGAHTVEVRAQNSAGNWEESYATTSASVGSGKIVTGAGYGGGPQIRLFSESGAVTHNGFFAYDSHVRSGVKVTTGDVNGDGIDEIITGTGSGGGPHIRIFTKAGNVYHPGFFAYAESFRGGVNVAAGDLDGDGIDEIIAGAGNGGGPHIRVYDGEGNPKLTNGFFAYDPAFRGGVNVATGDIDADGEQEIIAGAGQGGGPHIRVFEGDGTIKPITFFAFHPDNRSGISVAAADFDNDGKDEIVAGQLTNEETWVKVYKYNNAKTVLSTFRAYGAGVETGVNVATGDIDNDNIPEIVTGPNYGGGPQVRTFELNGTPINDFFAYATTFRGGTYVAVGDFE